MNGIETGFILDRQWYWLRGEMERTKRPALLALAQIFAEANVPYAIIGGVALQFHQTEACTTLDINVARMFQTCGSVTLSWSERTINTSAGSDDDPSVARPPLPRKRSGQARDVA